jgi:hypothetical protein
MIKLLYQTEGDCSFEWDQEGIAAFSRLLKKATRKLDSGASKILDV